VVRNDLASDDLELIPRLSKAHGRSNLAEAAPRHLKSGGWRGWVAHWRLFFQRPAC
jgi:hypothetical protein